MKSEYVHGLTNIQFDEKVIHQVAGHLRRNTMNS